MRDVTMIQTAAQTTVKALLSENNGAKYHYVIPPYQREYAWTKNQWDNLFDDLTDNDKGYFLGSLKYFYYSYISYILFCRKAKIYYEQYKDKVLIT